MAVSYYNITAIGLDVLYEAALANREALGELRDLANRLVTWLGTRG